MFWTRDNENALESNNRSWGSRSMHHGLHKNIMRQPQLLIIIRKHQISKLELFLKDYEDWSDDAENSALICYLRYIQIEKSYFKL